MRQAAEVDRIGRSIESIGRHDVEDLLYLEAELIDSWRLDEWLELYTEDANYFVPTNDLPTGDPAQDLVYINHDYARIKALVVRLNSSKAYREYPYSNVRHLITNVRLLEINGNELRASAAFMVWRYRNRDEDCYVGRYEYTLRLVDGELMIRRKEAVLDKPSLRPTGAVSIIL